MQTLEKSGRTATTENRIEKRARAFSIIKEKSFRRESVTLSSGQKSDHYFDMKPSMFCPEGAIVLSELILDRVKESSVDFVGGLEMGAVPLIGPLVVISAQNGVNLPGFFVRKEPKKHGTMKQIEGVDDLQGKRVVVVDDVTTTGKSALTAIQVLKDAGAEIVLVLSILDRQQGATELYEKEGLPFASLFQASEFLAL